MNLTVSTHIGEIRRVKSFNDLRHWEQDALLDIKARRVKRYAHLDIDTFVLNVISFIDKALTDKFILSSRMKARFVGSDISYKVICPDFISRSEWSSSLLDSFISDWYGYVIIESFFNKTFFEKMKSISIHRKYFLNFIYNRSLKRDLLPSRSCIEWCKKNLDGHWGLRQYGESVTKRILNVLPQYLAWADIYLSKRSGFGYSEINSKILHMSSLLGKDDSGILSDNDKEIMPELSNSILSMLRTSESDEYDLNDMSYQYDDPKYTNGANGIIAQKFMDYYVRNIDICFIYIVKHFIADYSKKNKEHQGYDGYGINSPLTKPAISSIRRQNGYLSDWKIDSRCLFWHSLVHDFNRMSPRYGTYDKKSHLIENAKIVNKLYYDFCNLPNRIRSNPLLLAENEFIRYTCFGYTRVQVSPYARQKYWRLVQKNFNKNTSLLFSFNDNRTIFKSKLTPENIFVIIDKATDLIYSGRLNELITYRRADGLHANYLLMKIIKSFIDEQGMIENADIAITCSNAFNNDVVKDATRKDILLSLSEEQDALKLPLRQALGKSIRSHKDFTTSYKQSIFDLYNDEDGNYYIPRHGMLPKGLNNSFYWNEWVENFDSYSSIDKGYAYYMFIGRMQLWNTYVSRSLIGYDTDSHLWLPDFKNLSHKSYKKQRLDGDMEYY